MDSGLHRRRQYQLLEDMSLRAVTRTFREALLVPGAFYQNGLLAQTYLAEFS
jgi:hypothetical protein